MRRAISPRLAIRSDVMGLTDVVELEQAACVDMGAVEVIGGTGSRVTVDDVPKPRAKGGIGTRLDVRFKVRIVELDSVMIDIECCSHSGSDAADSMAFLR